MNKEQIFGLVRGALQLGSGYFGVNAVMTTDEITAGIAAIVTLATLVWSFIEKKPKAA